MSDEIKSTCSITKLLLLTSSASQYWII